MIRPYSVFHFPTYETEFVLFLVVLENFVLPLSLDSLTHDVKCDVRTLNFRSDAFFAPPRKILNDAQKRLLCENVKNKRNDE